MVFKKYYFFFWVKHKYVVFIRYFFIENYKMISDLINEIAASERIICGWNYKGAIISNYLAIMNRVNLVIEKERVNSVSFLESIQSLLNSVCTKIKYYPTRTTRERLLIFYVFIKIEISTALAILKYTYILLFSY